MRLQYGMTKSALIFAPAAGVSPWEDVLGEIYIHLKNLNIDTTVMRCEEIYREICPTMSAFGLTEEDHPDRKRQVCSACVKGQDNSLNSKFIKNSALSIAPSHEDYDFADKAFKEISRENWISFNVDGIPLGKVAAYEFILNYKIKHETLSEKEWSLFRPHLFNTLLTYSFSANYFEKNTVDYVFCYNRYYSINNIFSIVAERYGAKVFTVQTEGPANKPNSRFHMFDNFKDHVMLAHSDAWKKFSNQPLSIVQTLKVVIHLASQVGLTRTLTYSSNPLLSLKLSEINKKLEIKNSNPLVLIPTSSADERFALEFLGFLPRHLVKNSDSLAILKRLVNVANTRPDLNFIFRVHPREYPNKREAIRSQHSKDLESYLSSIELPENVYINLPDHNISLNNLAFACDYILNSTSSVGVDLSALGLRVICFTPDELYIYPLELGSSEIDLDTAINGIPRRIMGNNEVTSIQRKSYRWIYFKYFDQTIPVLTHVKLVRRTDKILRYLRVQKTLRVFITKNAVPRMFSLTTTRSGFRKFDSIISNSRSNKVFKWKVQIGSLFEMLVIRFSTFVFRGLLSPK
jgi:hypothetical protein